MGVFTGLLAHVVTNGYLFDSLKFVILGSLMAYSMEGARQLFQWLIGRFRFRAFYSQHMVFIRNSSVL
jgi:hypothetical protein